MIADVVMDNYPPASLLPKAVAELVAARDAALEALNDFEEQHESLLRDDWAVQAEAADTLAAVDAVRAGRDPLAGPSALTKAREERPRVLAVHQMLTADLRRAEHAARKAVQRIAGELEAQVRPELEAAAKRAEDAYRAFLDAQGAFGAVGAQILALRAWANSDMADWVEGSASPRRADGASLVASNPIAALREVLTSFDAEVVPDPIVTVQRTDGETFTMRRSQARALVGTEIRKGQHLVIIGDDETGATDGDA